jgi:hypothetical protein
MSDYRTEKLFEFLKDNKEHSESDIIKNVYDNDLDMTERVRIDASELRRYSGGLKKFKRGSEYIYQIVLSEKVVILPSAFELDSKKKEQNKLI